MIPDFVDGLNLPPGNYACLWEEIVQRFGAGERRLKFCEDLRNILERAKECGFVKIVIWGSFTTAKTNPGDLDLLFVVRRGVTKDSVPPECAELMNGTAAKERWGHDFLYCPDEPETLESLIRGLGIDKITKRDRGVLVLDI